MTRNHWKVRPLIFGFGLLSMFLPFVAVSCQGQTVATATGVQLVTGFDASNPSTPSGLSSSRSVRQQTTQREGSEPLAVLALILMLIGFAFGFRHTRPSAILSAISGAIGVFALLRLKAKLDENAFQQGNGLFQLDYRAGFWLMLSLFVVALVYNGYLLTMRQDTPVGADPRYQTEPPY